MDAFNLAGLRVGFLQNYDAMMTSARVPLDAVEQLEFLCQDILRDDEPGSPVKGKKGKSCTLVTSLNSKLATYKATLQKLTAESQLYLTESTYAIEAYSSDESFDFSQILGQLQSCRVITVNEAIIIFLQAFDNLHDTIQRRLEGDLTGVSIADIDNLRIELHQYVETAPDTSTYAVYMEKRRQAITMLGALGDLVQHARRAWQELDRAIESCKEGESVSYDEYKSCVDKVKAARLEDAEIRVKYEELEVRITQFSERCGRVLPTITDPSTHFETLSELAETIKELPVTKQLREQILLRHDVCNLARKCISMTQNQHQSDGMDVDSDVNAVPSTTIFELRKLFQELQDLLHHVLKSASHVSHPIEESILTSIKPEFQFFYWQQEIAHLQVASIDKVFAEELHTLGIEIGAEVKAPDDWEALVVAIQALNALETEAAKVFETLAYAQVASNEAVRNSFSFKQRASLRNLSSGDTHSTDFDITSFALGGKAWKSSIGDSQAALHSLVSRSSELKVTKRDLIRSMEDALTITNKILDVQLQIMNIHISLVKSSDEDLIRKDLNQLQNNSAIEFRDLTALVNEFSSIAEKKSDFILVEMVSKFLLSFHTRATMWNDKAMSILPTKSTRRKKGEPKSITLKEIENLYHDPLCRAVKVPALMGVLALLQDARMLEAETLTLLNDRNAATSSSMSTSDKTNAEEEDYYSRKSLLEQIRAVNEKLVRIEMLPFDMAESSILSWFLEILTWVYNLPNLYLDYLSELHSTSMGGQNQDNKEAVGVMSLTDARKQVIQCNDLVNDRTSPDVVSWLLEKKILTEDISTGTHYYSDNVSPYLDRSQEIADQLKQWVDSAEELESRVHTGVSGGETLESLQSLLGEVNNSALFIDGALKRSLETFIQRQLKRSRDDSDSLLRAKASAPEDKKKKSKPTSVRCAYASCTSSVTNDSAYCSSECAIQHAPRLCKNMLAYRDVLCSAAPLPASVATLPHVVSLVEEDRLQYQLSPVSPIELFSDMTQEMNKRGYITASKFAESEKEKERLTLKNAKDYMSSYSSSGNSTPTGSMNTISIDDSVVERNESEPSSNNPTILENLLVKAEKFLSRSLLESGHTANSEALHRDRSKLTPAQVMLSSLPPRVTSIMARRGEAITAVSPKNPPNNQSVDMEMRKQVRFLFEDVFVAALSRQAISGALCMGSILALELEQELFNRAYVVVPPTSSGSKSEPRRELNKKDYKDNQMRLQRNLKQSHNDGLVSLFLIAYYILCIAYVFIWILDRNGK